MNLVGILVGLVILGLMMTVHELGHYLVGRRLGFNVIEFQIFMGPELFSWTRNGTKFSLRLLPIGAAVQFAGEYAEANETMQPGDFYERPKSYRAAVLAAGPLVNILTGILAFYILFSASGFATPTLAGVQANSLAAEAGLEAGDRITSFDGTAIRTDLDLSTSLQIADLGVPAEVTYIENETGEERQTSWTPELMTTYYLGITIDVRSEQVHVMEVDTDLNASAQVLQTGDIIHTVNGDEVTIETLPAVLEEAAGETFSVGLTRNGEPLTVEMSAVPAEVLRPAGIVLTLEEDPLAAIPYAFQYGWSMVTSNVRLLGEMFSGGISARDSLTGPVGIVQIFTGVVTNTTIDIGARLLQLLSLFGLISIALGFTNLLPIPPLDGNQLLLTAVEAVRGKRLSEKVQNIVTISGVVVILGLAAMALFFDISRILGG